MDSIVNQLDPNDPDYELKAAKLLEKLKVEMDHRLLIGDTSYVIGSEASEKVIDRMQTIFRNEEDTSYLSYDYANALPFLIVDLSGKDKRFTIDQAGSFSNLKILIIRGDLTNKAINMDSLFLLLENVRLTELYIENCREGVTHLPESIGNFETLRKLGLFGNAITDLPESISKLSLLEELYIDANPISTLPKGMDKLKKLKVLGVAKTKLPASEIKRVNSLLPQCKILIK